MPRIAGHVQAEELELYCLGGLTEVRCARVEEHLLLCDICRERLLQTENYVGAVAEAGRRWSDEHRDEPVAVAAAGRSWLSRLAPMLIAALLLVSVLAWFSRHSAVPAPAPFSVELAAVRGAAAGQAPARRPLLLELDLTGLSDGQPFAGEVVDSAGSRVARFPVAARAALKALPPGNYFVRVYKASGELLREYALTVKP